MDFTPGSLSNNPLTPAQLHELQLLQQEDEYHNSSNNNNATGSLANNEFSIPSYNTDVTADSIFWENNYTSQNIPQLDVHSGQHRLFQDQQQQQHPQQQLQQQHQHQSPMSASISPTDENEIINECIKRETEQDDGGAAGSSNVAGASSNSNGSQPDISEEELYLKRKAQNRAAQRAFRERKETKLKELSNKLSKTESEKEKLVQELENLKRQNTVLSTENQVLLKSGSIIDPKHNNNNSTNVLRQETISPIRDYTKTRTATSPSEASESEYSFPMNKTIFINDLILNTKHDLQKAVEYDTLVYEHEGSKLLTVGAVWDFLHEYSANHEELEIDVGQVMTLLKGNEVCHGFGPGYSMQLVKEAIDKVCSQ